MAIIELVTGEIISLNNRFFCLNDVRKCEVTGVNLQVFVLIKKKNIFYTFMNTVRCGV